MNFETYLFKLLLLKIFARTVKAQSHWYCFVDFNLVTVTIYHYFNWYHLFKFMTFPQRLTFVYIRSMLSLHP